MNLIVATSSREQQDIISFLKEKLKSEHYTDHTITVYQTNINQIVVRQRIKGEDILVAAYRVLIVPVSMSLDSIRGFSEKDNININTLLAKLDRMKAEAIAFVNSRKKQSYAVTKQKEAFAKATQRLFG